MITGNEPAHTLDGIYADDQRKEGYLTIRQHLASLAMQGIISNHHLTDSVARTCKTEPEDSVNKYPSVVIATMALAHADALISVLNNTIE